ncbi:MAG: hypothetical protein JWL84_5826 [Rhodospirillales bacterium]|nr:hypothetical protein [Rhodospirillales bacterium]
MIGRACRQPVVAAAAFGPVAIASPGYAAEPTDAPPLRIAKEGYVFAGGRYNTAIPGDPASGRLYAEFQVPEKLRQPYPS